jgi:hypothetical protein
LNACRIFWDKRIRGLSGKTEKAKEDHLVVATRQNSLYKIVKLQKTGIEPGDQSSRSNPQFNFAVFSFEIEGPNPHQCIAAH